MIRLNHISRALGAVAVLLLAACGGASEKAPLERATDVDVSSTDFALRPCGVTRVDQPCALLMAGGKRVLLGAPAGVRAGLSDQDLKNLDAVLLFSLRGTDIDGLGAIRNDSWLAGRSEPLKVTGPFGVSEVVAALNAAYEASDAFAYVEQGASGGFSAAVLASQRGEGEIFNTGDLIIAGREDTSGRMSYTASYDNTSLQILPCGHDANGKFQPRDGVFVMDCQEASENWPLTKTVLIETIAANKN